MKDGVEKRVSDCSASKSLKKDLLEDVQGNLENEDESLSQLEDSDDSMHLFVSKKRFNLVLSYLILDIKNNILTNRSVVIFSLN